jgi:cobalt-zinc-cadmium efflux system protein
MALAVQELRYSGMARDLVPSEAAPSLRLPRYEPPPLPPFAQRALARTYGGVPAPAPESSAAATPTVPSVCTEPPVPASHPETVEPPGHVRAPRDPLVEIPPRVAQHAHTPAQPPAAAPAHAHAHSHDHGPSDHDCSHGHGVFAAHQHDYTDLATGVRNRSLLRKALLIQAAFLVAEVAGGLAFNSLALLADAAHMLADVAAIALALAAAHLATNRPTDAAGHARPELQAAAFNGATLLLGTAVILFEALRRIGDPAEVMAGGTLVVATLGLAANVATAMLLMRADQDNVNIRATVAHTVTDAISSVGVIVVAIVIGATGWHVLDPVASVVIALIIARMAWPICTESLRSLKAWAPAAHPVTAPG